MYVSGTSVSRTAYYLALIGGILLLIFGLLSHFGYSVVYFGPFFYVAFAYYSIVTIICGIIAIIGAKKGDRCCLGNRVDHSWNPWWRTWWAIGDPWRIIGLILKLA